MFPLDDADELVLDTLSALAGYTILGGRPGQPFGFSASSAGDFNDDGIPDLVVGAPQSRGDSVAYVIFGQGADGDPVTSVSALDGSNGFAIPEATVGEQMGASVSGAGDVNGDGVDDIILGARRADDPDGGENVGAAYVIFGSSAEFSESFDLSTLDGSNGFAIFGSSFNANFGSAVSGAGDLNDDGFDDLVVGQPNGTAPGGGVGNGGAYIVFGAADGHNGVIRITDLDGSNGVVLPGNQASANLGASVAAAGDINNDQIDDVILGAPTGDPLGRARGTAFVLFGEAATFSASLDVTQLDGTDGFAVRGVEPVDSFNSNSFGERVGDAVGAAGDVNGDGIDDVVIGATGALTPGSATVFGGATYVVFGSETAFDPIIETSAIDGTNGFKIAGGFSRDRIGTSVSGAGDMNGDGIDDLVIGNVPRDNVNDPNRDKAYLIFGSAEADRDDIDVRQLDGTLGFRITVPAQAPGDPVNPNELGRAVAGIGDINGDGVVDVLVGAPDEQNISSTIIGEVYVVFGQVVRAIGALSDTDGAADAIAENAAAGTPVGVTAFAEDGNAADTVSYTVDDPRFRIGETSGVVTLADGMVLDAEAEGAPTIPLRVTATSTDGTSTEATFEIALLDVDEFDVEALVDQDLAVDQITDRAMGGDPVGITIVPEDADRDDTVTVTVSDARFAFDEAGVLRVADGAVFDDDAEPVIDLTITAMSTDGSVAELAERIDVVNENDNPVRVFTPTSPDGTLVIEVEEARNLFILRQLDVRDPDVGDFVTSGVLLGPTFGDYFLVPGSFGGWNIQASPSPFDLQAFNAEARDFYENTARFTSSDGSTVDLPVEIRVRDVEEFPLAIEQGTSSVEPFLRENSEGQTVTGLFLTVSDRDLTDDVVSVSVDDARFELLVDGSLPGPMVRVRPKLLDGVSLDAEEQATVELLIEAVSSDGSTASLPVSFEVRDRDEFGATPVVDIATLAPNRISEFAPAGTFTGIRAFSEDADATDEVDGYVTGDERFTIEPNGDVFRSDVGGISFEVEPQIDLEIIPIVSGQEDRSAASTIPIEVLNVEEPIILTDVDPLPNIVEDTIGPGVRVPGLNVRAADGDGTAVSLRSLDERFNLNGGFFQVSPGDRPFRTAFGDLDPINEPVVQLAIEATSLDGSTLTEVFEIQVIEGQVPVGMPVDSAPTANRVLATAAAGTPTGIVLDASDPNAADTLTFEVVTEGFTLGADGRAVVTDGTSFADRIPPTETSVSLTVEARVTSSDTTSATSSFTVEVVRMPQLSITFDEERIDEGGSTRGTVSIDVVPSGALEVALLAAPADELGLPARVTIPAGQTSVSFDVRGVIDFIEDGDRLVDVVASASDPDAAMASDPAEITVRDVAPPVADMVITPGGTNWLLDLTEGGDTDVGVSEETESAGVTGFGPASSLLLIGGGRPARFNDVGRGSVTLEIDRRDGPETDLTLTLSGGIYEDDTVPFGVDSFVLAYDDEADVTLLRLAEGVGSAAERIAGTDGPDRLALPDFSVPREVDGRAGADALAIPATLGGSRIDIADGAVTVSGPEGEPAVIRAVERFEFADGAAEFDAAPEIAALAHLYTVCFDRAYDVPGISFWRDRLEAGLTLAEIAESFARSGEFAERYGADLADRDFIAQAYENGLDRAADPAGLDFWAGGLAIGALRRGDVLAAFAASDEIADLDAFGIGDGVLTLA